MNKKVAITLGVILGVLIVGGGAWYLFGNKKPANITPQNNITPAKQESLKFSKENFPRVDGATAMKPMQDQFTSILLGISKEEASKFITYNKTIVAYENLINKKKDIVFAFGPSSDEIAQAKAKGVEFEVIPIGKDALVFMINNGNPVKTLTTEQIQQIFEGKITNWKTVGGADIEIVDYQRPLNSGSQTLMEKHVMSGRTFKKVSDDRVRAEMDSLLDAVSALDQQANGIGYSVFYYASEMYSKPNLRMLAVNGVLPTKESIKTGEYPFTEPVVAVIRKDEPQDSDARKMINWILSAQGQQAVAAGGFVPLK